MDSWGPRWAAQRPGADSDRRAEGPPAAWGGGSRGGGKGRRGELIALHALTRANALIMKRFLVQLKPANDVAPKDDAAPAPTPAPIPPVTAPAQQQTATDSNKRRQSGAGSTTQPPAKLRRLDDGTSSGARPSRYQDPWEKDPMFQFPETDPLRAGKSFLRCCSRHTLKAESDMAECLICSLHDGSPVTMTAHKEVIRKHVAAHAAKVKAYQQRELERSNNDDLFALQRQRGRAQQDAEDDLRYNQLVVIYKLARGGRPMTEWDGWDEVFELLKVGCSVQCRMQRCMLLGQRRHCTNHAAAARSCCHAGGHGQELLVELRCVDDPRGARAAAGGRAEAPGVAGIFHIGQRRRGHGL